MHDAIVVQILQCQHRLREVHACHVHGQWAHVFQKRGAVTPYTGDVDQAWVLSLLRSSAGQGLCLRIPLSIAEFYDGALHTASARVHALSLAQWATIPCPPGPHPSLSGPPSCAQGWGWGRGG